MDRTQDLKDARIGEGSMGARQETPQILGPIILIEVSQTPFEKKGFLLRNPADFLNQCAQGGDRIPLTGWTTVEYRRAEHTTNPLKDPTAGHIQMERQHLHQLYRPVPRISQADYCW